LGISKIKTFIQSETPHTSPHLSTATPMLITRNRLG
jgi:hypothetical protein